MLKSLIKANLNEKKELGRLVDEFIENNSKKLESDLEAFLKELRVYIYKRYGKVDEALLKELVGIKLKEFGVAFKLDSLDTIYDKMAEAGAISAAVALGVKPKFSFDSVDVEAIRAMKDSFYWSGREYNKRFEEAVKGVIEEVFEGKIARDELSKILESRFGELLKKDSNYFKGLVDHIINQAQNIARVQQALKYNIKAFRVVARLDNRTSDICRSMHGRIISAKHLEKQTEALLSAKSIGEKKNAAIWMNKPHFGKLPENFGLPPYHFRCRTMVVPVVLHQEVIDGKRVNYSQKSEDDVICHIDKSGVERHVKSDLWSHSKSSMSRKTPKKDIIAALNSIEKIAPHIDYHDRFVAKSSNGYFLVFAGDKVITAFKPTSKRGKSSLDDYFKKSAKIDKAEVIKWDTQLRLEKEETGVLGLIRGLIELIR